MKKKSRQDQLEQLVGDQVYSVWVDMLRRLVPEGRTHRLAPTIAAMLEYATEIAHEKGSAPEEGTAAHAFTSSGEAGYEAAEDALMPLVKKLFKDAGVEYARTSASGERYSVAEEAIHEFVDWFNMPWES